MSLKSKLDANQVIQTAGANITDTTGGLGGGLGTINLGGTLVPEQYDELDLTYVAAGNGAGEIETVTYKLNTATIATLTLTYDAQNRITNVVRS